MNEDFTAGVVEGNKTSKKRTYFQSEGNMAPISLGCLFFSEKLKLKISFSERMYGILDSFIAVRFCRNVFAVDKCEELMPVFC